MTLAGTVWSVLGPIGAGDLGIVLPHEHLLIRNPSYNAPDEASERARGEEPVGLENLGWVRWNWTSNRDNLVLDDEDLATTELSRFAAAGGGCLVDPTVPGIGRDPLALARISRRTGVAIVMGAGYYVAASHPPGVATMPEPAIADAIEHDLSDGVGATGVRAGVIGEIGCGWPLEEAERRVLRGAAKAQRRTDAAMIVHVGRDRSAPFEIVRELESAGAALDRVVLAHLDRTVTDLEGLRELGSTGVWLSFDNFGLEPSYYPFRIPGIDTLSDAQRLDLVARCLDAGLGGRVLISQDICTKHRLVRYGGHGYDHVLTNLVPWMLRRGFSREDVETLLVDGPVLMLTGVHPGREPAPTAGPQP